MAAKISEVSSSDPAHAARKKNLDLALQQIVKDYGEGAIMRLGDDNILPVEVIPTGNILIDRALGVGGFPRGRVIEIFGPESSGKTTLTLTVIAQAQKRGGLAGSSMSSMHSTRSMPGVWESTWMTCWSPNQAQGRKHCAFAKL